MSHSQPTDHRTAVWQQRYSTQNWTIGQRATLAVTLEASARKLGNVHPQASFSDMGYEDFLRSAISIGPCFDTLQASRVGKLVYTAVSATRLSVNVNTNLGTLLLIAPIAIATHNISHSMHHRDAKESQRQPLTLSELRQQTAAVIEDLNAEDSQLVYDAIRVAAPGGLGKTDKLDVHHQAAPENLIEAMRVVEEIDQIAKTYCSHFHFFFDEVIPSLKSELESWEDTHLAVRLFQLRWLARFGDSLVLRKLGEKENLLLREKATQLLKTFEHEKMRWTDQFESHWQTVDHWMREDGHRRNPGTTADLIAAGLFALLCCEP